GRLVRAQRGGRQEWGRRRGRLDPDRSPRRDARTRDAVEVLRNAAGQHLGRYPGRSAGRELLELVAEDGGEPREPVVELRPAKRLDLNRDRARRSRWNRVLESAGEG